MYSCTKFHQYPLAPNRSKICWARPCPQRISIFNCQDKSWILSFYVFIFPSYNITRNDNFSFLVYYCHWTVGSLYMLDPKSTVTVSAEVVLDPLQWRHTNAMAPQITGNSNHWLHNFLFNSLFRLISKKASISALLALCDGFPHKGSVIWKAFPRFPWRHHAHC